MSKTKKVIVILLLILNAVVLLGQIWPEGAPPFGRIVNIAFLSFNFIFFLILIRNRKN